MSALVFVPSTSSSWRATLSADEVFGHTDTPSLREACALGPDDDEDAEHAAMVIASVAGLAEFGTRFVVALELNPVTLTPVAGVEHNGTVVAHHVSVDQVAAFFSDDTGVDPSHAARAAHGLGVDEAWDLEPVQRLVSEHALLWHAASELPGPSARAEVPGRQDELRSTPAEGSN